MIDTSLMRARRNISLQSEMPTLKHFFPCNNATDRIVDTQGGVEWSPTYQGVAAGANYEYVSSIQAFHSIMEFNYASFGDGATPVPLMNGAWTEIPTGHAFMVVVAAQIRNLAFGFSRPDPIGFPDVWIDDSTLYTFPTNTTMTRFALGDNNNIHGNPPHVATGLGLSNHPFHWNAGFYDENAKQTITGAGSNPAYSLTSLTAPNGTDIVKVLAYTPGNPIANQYRAYNMATGALVMETDYTFVSPPDNASFVQTLPTFTPLPYFRMSGLALYGASLYVFPSGALPIDAWEGALWEGAAWKEGYRVPYPGAVLWE